MIPFLILSAGLEHFENWSLRCRNCKTWRFLVQWPRWASVVISILLPFTHCSLLCHCELSIGDFTAGCAWCRFHPQSPTPGVTRGCCPCSNEPHRVKVTPPVNPQPQRLSLTWVSFCTKQGKNKPNKQAAESWAGQEKFRLLCNVKVSKAMAFTCEIAGTQDLGLVSALLWQTKLGMQRLSLFMIQGC